MSSELDIPILRKQALKILRQCFFDPKAHQQHFAEYERLLYLFGINSAFYKIWYKLANARRLRCPHCGHSGILAKKTTVSKKKYRYWKLYVYHETFAKSPHGRRLRTQRWCYLNKKDLSNHVVQRKVQRMERFLNIEKHLARCIFAR
jgi:ribosomal protein S27AE